MPMGNNQRSRFGPNFRPAVGPQYSQDLNARIVSQDTTDGNIGAYENMYGSPGYAPSPYSTGQQGLSPQGQQSYDDVSGQMDQTYRRFAQTFGHQTATLLMQEMLKELAQGETAPHSMTQQKPTGAMPSPPGSISPRNLPRK